LKIRPQASSSSDHFACVPPGTILTSSEGVPYWRRVTLANGRNGWAAKKFLIEPNGPTTPPGTIPANAWLEVHFVDVGQGDGIWIHTFDDGIANGRFEGKNIIIDGGPDASDANNELMRYVEDRAHHNAIIDALFVSHPHDDHYPGAEGILRHFAVRAYYDPGFPKEGSEYPAFLASVPANIKRMGRSNFGTLNWGSEVQAEVLYAYDSALTGMGSGNTLQNNSSIVLRLQYGDKVFLFMGDAEGKARDGSTTTPKYAEKVLLDTQRSKLKANVLKIAHHGSETSSTIPFIEAVDPDVVVVSSGRKNYKGGGTEDRFLPDKSTLQRYCDHKADTRIYRTDQNDAQQGRTTKTDADGDHIVIRTNGTELHAEALEAGQPITISSCRA
jgi:competence protein ComEC